MDTSRGFNVKHAGAPLKTGAGGVVSHFEHQRIAPQTRVTTDNGNFAGGQEVHFRIKSSSSRWFIPKMSKLMVTMTVRDGAGGAGAPATSVRFVTCPVSQMFSSARVVIGNTSIETRGSNYGLLSQFATRNNVSREAGKTAGSGSLLDFDTLMVAANGAEDTFLAQAAVGEIPVRRNMKQDIIQTAAGSEFQISEGINLDVLSTDAWFPGCTVDIYLLINPHYAQDMLYSGDVADQVRFARDANVAHTDITGNAAAGGGHKALITLGAGGLGPPVINIKELHFMAKFAMPITGLLKVPSFQLAYETVTYAERHINTSTSFEETFTVPPGVRAVCIFSREKLNDIQLDNGRFAAAGGGTDTVKGVAIANAAGAITRSHQPFTRLQCELGGITAPTLEYTNLDLPHLKASRLYDTYLSFFHNCEASRGEAVDLKEFCESPIAYLHLMQKPGTSASVLTVRGAFAGDTVAGGQQHLCVVCIHARVLEMEYSAEEDDPVKISIQPIV